MSTLLPFKQRVGGSSPPTLTKIAQHPAFAKYSPKTRWMYEHYLSTFESLIGPLPLDEISPEHVDIYIATRLGQVKASSVWVEVRTLKAAFYHLVRWRILKSNPFQFARVKLDKHKPSHFTHEEFNSFIAIITQEWFRKLCTFTVYTGLRREEVTELKWCNVDYERRTILIESDETIRVKCGGMRVVPLNTVAYEILKSLPMDSKYVFHHVHGRWIDRLFTRYRDTVKLSKTLHFHSLRHTFATWLIEKGVPIYEVKELLGHTDIKVTELYAHMNVEKLRGAVDRL